MTFTSRGEWPSTWPAELDFLRDRSFRVEGPIVTERHYIPFTAREDFEKAWPYLLQVKPKNRLKAIRLVSPPLNSGVFKELPALTAGVVVTEHPGPHSASQGAPLTLVVDGEIVDLNRIAFPRDTPIIDDRFAPVTFEVAEQIELPVNRGESTESKTSP